MLLTDDRVDGGRRSGPRRSPDGQLQTRHRSDEAALLRLYTYRDHVALCVAATRTSIAEIDLEACTDGLGHFDSIVDLLVVVPSSWVRDQLGAGGDNPSAERRAPQDVARTLSPKASSPGLAKLGDRSVVLRARTILRSTDAKIAGLGLYLDGEGGLLFHSSGSGRPRHRVHARRPRHAGIEARCGRRSPPWPSGSRLSVARPVQILVWGDSPRGHRTSASASALGVELEPSQNHIVGANSTGPQSCSRPSTTPIDWRLQRSPRSDTTGSSLPSRPPRVSMQSSMCP